MKLQEFRQFNKATVLQPVRGQFVVPAFTLPAETWDGASLLVASIPLNNSSSFSLKLPIDTFGENFIAAVAYVSGDFMARWKLFDHDDAVLHYPVYAGEVLEAGARIEIWSVESDEDLVLAEAKIIEASVLTFPQACSQCCEVPSSVTALSLVSPSEINPYAYCNPFCLPLEVV